MNPLIIFFALLFIFPGSSFAQAEDFPEVSNLREDIQIINLLNSLDLKKEQMEFILARAREAMYARKEAVREASAYESDMLASLNAIKKDVESGKVTVEGGQARRFHKVKEGVEDMSRQAQGKIQQLAKDIEAKLEPYQLIALDGYKPCVIPIVSEGRIGQAGSSKGIEKALERVNEMPQTRYIENKDILAQRIIDKIPHSNDADEAKAKEEIMAVFEQVRGIQGVDFQLKKSFIAKELEDKLIPNNPDTNRLTKIKKFLLSENIVPILEKKIRISM